jgi:hypothetical protein
MTPPARHQRGLARHHPGLATATERLRAWHCHERRALRLPIKSPAEPGLERSYWVSAVGLDEPPTPSAYLRERFAAFLVDRFAVLFFAVDRFAVFLLDFFVAALAIAVVLSVPLLRARESHFPLTIENH